MPEGQKTHKTPITGCIASLTADGFFREVFACQLG